MNPILIPVMVAPLSPVIVPSLRPSLPRPAPTRAGLAFLLFPFFFIFFPPKFPILLARGCHPRSPGATAARVAQEGQSHQGRL